MLTVVLILLLVEKGHLTVLFYIRDFLLVFVEHSNFPMQYFWIMMIDDILKVLIRNLSYTHNTITLVTEDYVFCHLKNVTLHISISSLHNLDFFFFSTVQNLLLIFSQGKKICNGVHFTLLKPVLFVLLWNLC